MVRPTKIVVNLIQSLFQNLVTFPNSDLNTISCFLFTVWLSSLLFYTWNYELFTLNSVSCWVCCFQKVARNFTHKTEVSWATRYFADIVVSNTENITEIAVKMALLLFLHISNDTYSVQSVGSTVRQYSPMAVISIYSCFYYLV